MNDFVQLMLEHEWKSHRIWKFIKDYNAKSKIDLMGLRELFLLFVVKRKLKLMSLLISTQESPNLEMN